MLFEKPTSVNDIVLLLLVYSSKSPIQQLYSLDL